MEIGIIKKIAIGIILVCPAFFASSQTYEDLGKLTFEILHTATGEPIPAKLIFLRDGSFGTVGIMNQAGGRGMFPGVLASLSVWDDWVNLLNWSLGPFTKEDKINPCLGPVVDSTFICPVRGESIHWEEKDVFNPAVAVREGKIYLLYRAEDKVGRYNGTSRIGLAISSDGRSFTRHPAPVLYPDNDFMKKYEWEGGCEDPRIVEDEKGTYYMTYTAYDGNTARLCVATSPDLIHWEKHGLAFAKACGGQYHDFWSKSGSIISRSEGSRLVATQIADKYWMYWGDTNIYAATSDNLKEWIPVEKDGFLLPVLTPRLHHFDSELVESGPPALLSKNGVLLIYNSRNKESGGEPELPAGTYAAGQVLFDHNDPIRIIKRSSDCFFYPDREYEITGQVNNVCFLEGLVYFGKEWLLYYGTADSKIAVASYKP